MNLGKLAGLGQIVGAIGAMEIKPGADLRKTLL
jgi:hypothetical protein